MKNILVIKPLLFNELNKRKKLYQTLDKIPLNKQMPGEILKGKSSIFLSFFSKLFEKFNYLDIHL